MAKQFKQYDMWGYENFIKEYKIQRRDIDTNGHVNNLNYIDFALETIDEELFVQDIEGFFDVSINYDYTNPQQLFDLIKDSGILLDDNKYDLGEAVCDAIGFEDWSEFVEQHGENWVDYFCFYDYSYIA